MFELLYSSTWSNTSFAVSVMLYIGKNGILLFFAHEGIQNMIDSSGICLIVLYKKQHHEIKYVTLETRRTWFVEVV